MIELIIFILTSYGITMIISKEWIMKWFRTFIKNVFKSNFLNKLIGCPQCLSVYISLILSFIFQVPFYYCIIVYTFTRIINTFLADKIFEIE